MFRNLKIMTSANIHSIHGKLLVPKKTIITTDIFEKISQESSFSPRINVKIKETFINNDVFLCSLKDPYRSFCKKVGESDVLKIFGDIVIPAVILEEYHFMRIKDEYTYIHSINTTLLIICMSLLFFDDYQKLIQVSTASLTHDIGKSRLPSSILHSTMPLTNSEFDMIKEHTLYGAILCTHYFGSFYAPATVAAFQHHEKKNGTGYPLSIKQKDDVVMFITVADIFDALVSSRPYRNAPFDIRGAIDVLCQAVENNEIDEEKIKMLVALNRQKKQPLSEITYSYSKRGNYPTLNYYGIRSSFRN